MLLKKTTSSMILSTCLIIIALILCTAGTALAGVQSLGTPVETNTDITATGDELRVTIPTTASQGGNDADLVTVSLSGTGLNASDVASVAAFYGGVEAGRVSSPGALTNIPISLPGNQKGGSDWTFYVNFNSGASVTNFVYTVETGMVGVNEQGNLPFSTSGASVNVSAPNNPPVLTINQPDGVGDSVTAGTSYNIDYDLTDGDSVADVDFYYDTNSSGEDGTAITNCQNQGEGANQLCAWDTTGLNGDYWVYGIASDPENGPQPGDYSSGALTVTVPSGDVLSVTTNTPVASVANQGDLDVEMQWLQVDCSNDDDTNCIINTVTVDDLQTSTTGKIDLLEVHIDANSTFSDGTLGSSTVSTWDGQTNAIDMTAGDLTAGERTVTFGTSKYIWIIYDLNTGASGSIESSVTSIAVDTPDSGATGTWNSNNFTIVAPNALPDDPTSLDQLDLSSVSITPGGTTTEKTVQIEAFLSDANTSDNLWLEVEMADYAGGAGSFSNTPNCASASTVPGSGGTATAICSNLISGVSYMWRARSDDGTDISNWVDFPPGDPDVVISNTAPTAPADHNQYKMDGTSAISQDGVTDETTIKVKATVNDPSDQDDLKLEVEIADYAGGGGSYTGTPNCSDDFVAEGSVATATCINLIDGKEYMWRARTNDGVTTSAWQDFGTARDVTIARGVASDTLMHNSINLGTVDYGSGEETWGVAGGRYGEFVCETCHTAFGGITSNIKRIKDSFTTPDSSNWPSGSPTSNTVIFTDAREGTSDFGDNTSPFNGVCNVCHTDVNSNHPHYNYAASDGHNINKDCTSCHKHVDAFVGSGDCLDCHKTANTAGAPEVEPEFGRNSHHVMKTWADMTAEGDGVGSLVCIACHAEGKLNTDGTAGLNSTYHNNTPSGKMIDLIDATDVTRTTVFSFNIDDLVAKNDAANTAFDNFCMSCHREGGAAAVGGGNWPAAYTSVNPFGETTNIRTNAYDQYQKEFLKDGGGLAVYEDFLKVYDDSGADNDGEKENHHAVDGNRYTASYLAPTYLSSSVALYDGTTGVVDGSTLHCNDCHSTAFSSHGGNNEYMLQTATAPDPSAEHTSWTEYVCIKCHIGVPYTDGAAHTQSSSNYVHDSTTVGVDRVGTNLHRTGITCLNCHDGTTGFGGIHGFSDASFSASTNGGDGGLYWKRRFLPGTGLDQVDLDIADSPSMTDPNLNDGTWASTGGNGKCYTLGFDTNVSGCVKHTGMGQNYTNSRLGRPVDY